jgi:hypothetical protein
VDIIVLSQKDQRLAVPAKIDELVAEATPA